MQERTQTHSLAPEWSCWHFKWMAFVLSVSTVLELKESCERNQYKRTDLKRQNKQENYLKWQWHCGKLNFPCYWFGCMYHNHFKGGLLCWFPAPLFYYWTLVESFCIIHSLNDPYSSCAGPWCSSSVQPLSERKFLLIGCQSVTELLTSMWVGLLCFSWPY